MTTTTEKLCPGCGIDILVNEAVEFAEPANWCRSCGGCAPTVEGNSFVLGLAHLLTEASEEKDRIADPETFISPATVTAVEGCGKFIRVYTRSGRRYVVTVREEM